MVKSKVDGWEYPTLINPVDVEMGFYVYPGFCTIHRQGGHPDNLTFFGRHGRGIGFHWDEVEYRYLGTRSYTDEIRTHLGKRFIVHRVQPTEHARETKEYTGSFHEGWYMKGKELYSALYGDPEGPDYDYITREEFWQNCEFWIFKIIGTQKGEFRSRKWVSEDSNEKITGKWPSAPASNIPWKKESSKEDWYKEYNSITKDGGDWWP